jgi:hypothetical protein
MGYNVKQSSTSNGVYAVIATNLSGVSFTNIGLMNGTRYYYRISAWNLAGESPNSAAVSAQPVSLSPTEIGFGAGAGQVQLNWPQDHTGWRLLVQTNSLTAGLATNWVTFPGSAATNRVFCPIDPDLGSVFYRLVYP